jgi:predicted anti-sigma-YlaC factor YlaD
MSACKKSVEKLVDYLRNELDELDEALLEEHLAGCKDCCDRADFQQKLSQIILERSRIGDCPDVVKQTIIHHVRAEDALETAFRNCAFNS